MIAHRHTRPESQSFIKGAPNEIARPSNGIVSPFLFHNLNLICVHIRTWESLRHNMLHAEYTSIVRYLRFVYFNEDILETFVRTKCTRMANYIITCIHIVLSVCSCGVSVWMCACVSVCALWRMCHLKLYQYRRCGRRDRHARCHIQFISSIFTFICNAKFIPCRIISNAIIDKQCKAHLYGPILFFATIWAQTTWIHANECC